MSEERPRAVLTVTDEARAHVLSVRAEEPGGDGLALWVEVSGERNGQFTYDLYFAAASEAAPGDAVLHHDELTVVVPERSVGRLAGATLGMSEDGSELVITNPNAPSPPPTPEVRQGDLSSEVAQRVLSVLTEEINPAIAMHGGRADLVAVEEGVVYLRLSGGCQGCGLAAVTLTQGIEVAIKEAVPEIVSVVDVTDHASGTNPYYEPAKK